MTTNSNFEEGFVVYDFSNLDCQENGKNNCFCDSCNCDCNCDCDSCDYCDNCDSCDYCDNCDSRDD